MSIKDTQNDLFDVGFDPGPADGVWGEKSERALEAFDAALDYAPVIQGYVEVDVMISPYGPPPGARWNLRNWIALGWRYTPEYTEQRVRVSRYGRIDRGDQRLVSGLHWRATEALEAMRAASGLELAVASGWRPHRWRSRSHYESTMVAVYGSVAKGRKWLAFDSPHETGLAVDFGSDGLRPRSATADAQRDTPAHEWLVGNAHLFGFRPYKREPWHWEFPLSERAFKALPPGPMCRE
jgi:hypothetical protein